MFDSAEEKAAKKQAREAEEAQAAADRAAQEQAAAEERRRQAWLAGPVGAATAAKTAGQGFFEVQLEVGAHQGTASWGAATGRRDVVSSAGTLGEIEQVGWRLEHASHVFMVTGQTGTERVFLSGENTAVSGAMVGVYLFRNDPAVPAPADPYPST
jgi:hypothetical protein